MKSVRMSAAVGQDLCACRSCAYEKTPALMWFYLAIYVNRERGIGFAARFKQDGTLAANGSFKLKIDDEVVGHEKILRITIHVLREWG